MIYILFNSKGMINTFSDFVNVIRKDPQVGNRINDMLDRYNRLLIIINQK